MLIKNFAYNLSTIILNANTVLFVLISRATIAQLVYGYVIVIIIVNIDSIVSNISIVSNVIIVSGVSNVIIVSSVSIVY